MGRATPQPTTVAIPLPSASIPAEAGIQGQGNPTTNPLGFANNPHPPCPPSRKPHRQRPAHPL